jgi:uncharacterized damage-inducible protein DinB
MRGPVEGVPSLLQPVAHALLQAREDVLSLAEPLSAERVWARPSRAASAGYHLRHLAGALDRLLTYARGEALSEVQLASLTGESLPGEPPASGAALAAGVAAAIERALTQLRVTHESSLLDPRGVGRQQLPSTVLGLLFHAAEHTTRHAGQFITTIRMQER